MGGQLVGFPVPPVRIPSEVPGSPGSCNDCAYDYPNVKSYARTPGDIARVTVPR